MGEPSLEVLGARLDGAVVSLVQWKVSLLMAGGLVALLGTNPIVLPAGEMGNFSVWEGGGG